MVPTARRGIAETHPATFAKERYDFLARTPRRWHFRSDPIAPTSDHRAPAPDPPRKTAACALPASRAAGKKPIDSLGVGTTLPAATHHREREFAGQRRRAAPCRAMLLAV